MPESLRGDERQYALGRLEALERERTGQAENRPAFVPLYNLLYQAIELAAGIEALMRPIGQRKKRRRERLRLHAVALEPDVGLYVPPEALLAPCKSDIKRDRRSLSGRVDLDDLVPARHRAIGKLSD